MYSIRWETSIAPKINVSLPSDFKYTEMKGYAGSYGSSTEDNSLTIWTKRIIIFTGVMKMPVK